MKQVLEETSYSQQRTLLRCPKKFEYQYIRRLRPKQEEARFLLGRAVHKFLEVYYEDGYDTAYKTFKDYVQQNFPQTEEAHEQADLAEGMIKHYAKWAEQNDNFTVLGTEVPFELDINGTKFRGIIDGIVQIGKEIWAMEHKTANQINTRHTLIDKQISTYVMVGRELGIPITGVIYNTLRKALPQKPRVLKNGRLSTSLNNNITYSSYIDAIEELGHTPEMYQDVLDELKARENTFFHREFVPRTEASSEETWDDIRKTEALKQALVGANIFPRNDTRDCVWDCPFVDLCLAELEGNDIEMLINDKFIIDYPKG